MTLNRMLQTGFSVVLFTLGSVAGSGCAQTGPAPSDDSVAQAVQADAAPASLPAAPDSISEFIDPTCTNAGNFLKLAQPVNEGRTCEDGLDSFLVRLPDGTVVVANIFAALETCFQTGHSGRFLKYFGGPDTSLADFCFDYSDRTARSWTSYFGCCAAETAGDEG